MLQFQLAYPRRRPPHHTDCKWNCFPGAADICVRNALIYRKCICRMGKDSIPGLPWMSHGLQRPARLSFVFHFTQKTRQPEGSPCPPPIPVEIPLRLPLAAILSRHICFPEGAQRRCMIIPIRTSGVNTSTDSAPLPTILSRNDWGISGRLGANDNGSGNRALCSPFSLHNVIDILQLSLSVHFPQP